MLGEETSSEALISIIRTNNLSFKEAGAFVRSEPLIRDNADLMASVAREFDLPVLPDLLTSYMQVDTMSYCSRMFIALDNNDSSYVRNNIDDDSVDCLVDGMLNVNPDVAMMKAIVDGCNSFDANVDQEEDIDRMYEYIWDNKELDLNAAVYLVKNSGADLGISEPWHVLPTIIADPSTIDNLFTGPRVLADARPNQLAEVVKYILRVGDHDQDVIDEIVLDNEYFTILLGADLRLYPTVLNVMDVGRPGWERDTSLLQTIITNQNNILLISKRDRTYMDWLQKEVESADDLTLVNAYNELVRDHPELGKLIIEV